MILILYENESCIVVNKPANMPAQKDFSRTLDMLSVTESYLGKKAFLIHRLDRHVAGPVVIAKTKEAAAALNKQMNSEKFQKIYKAVVVPGKNSNLIEGETIELSHFLAKDKNRAIIISDSQYESLNDNDKIKYKKAKLKYTCDKIIDYDTIKLALLEVELLTGRFHQIRSQLSYCELPILGDPKYGVTQLHNITYSLIGLQSVRLQFINPKTKKILTAECEHSNEPFQLFQ